MHVVLITTSYPDSVPGREAAGGFVADFARHLARHVRVSVVAAATSTSVRTEHNLRVHRFAVRRWPLSLLRPHHPVDWWSIYETLRDGLHTLDAVVAADPPDHALALWALPSGHWARLMKGKYGIRYSVWALGSDIWSLGRLPLLRGYLRRVLRQADRRYADGLQLGEDVASLGGVPCEFLPSSRVIDYEQLTDVADSAPYKLAFLGRWHPNKGIDILLDALRQLSAEDWQKIAAVRICGGGPLEAEVHRAVAELQALGRAIDVGGYLDAAAAAELLAWADYVALPSRIESTPVIFSDAAQLRRPLLASPVGDLPRLFEQHDCGVLASETAAGAYADAIRRALRIRAAQFGGPLEAVAEQFDVAKAARKFVRDIEGSTG